MIIGIFSVKFSHIMRYLLRGRLAIIDGRKGKFEERNHSIRGIWLVVVLSYLNGHPQGFCSRVGMLYKISKSKADRDSAQWA